jgi:hypothetical protein
MGLLSTSCQSSNAESIVKESRGYRLIGASKSIDKIPKNKIFKLTDIPGSDDALLTMTAANQIEMHNSMLLIRPTFQDSSSKLESKLIHRDGVVTLFEVTQKSNSRLGYVLSIRSRECCT